MRMHTGFEDSRQQWKPDPPSNTMHIKREVTTASSHTPLSDPDSSDEDEHPWVQPAPGVEHQA